MLGKGGLDPRTQTTDRGLIYGSWWRTTDHQHGSWSDLRSVDGDRKLNLQLLKICIFGPFWIRVVTKGTLSPSYVGPYQILKRIGKVAYEFELPADLAAVHPIFHISLLNKCVGDPASVVSLEAVAVKYNLSYEDVPVEILDRQVRRLRNKEVTSVKV
ncbi:hypothetical protein MTR67_018647 [Solanum verrucosum]|uniref:Tf2-1-like SH3-like domain-containing protein n=1 Tax=Solanum verrucosum TaxID=315347 RepID=A0AAF0QM51_SOLVR|nr:hypothetical protein MTR67_018647 [Solanum verrucosum]